jgi:hypothetical protein
VPTFGSYGIARLLPYLPHDQHVNLTASTGVTNVTPCPLHFLDSFAMTGKNRIMIYGPKDDGTYVVEFRTADGDVLAISIPRIGRTSSGISRSECPTACSCRMCRLRLDEERPGVHQSRKMSRCSACRRARRCSFLARFSVAFALAAARNQLALSRAMAAARSSVLASSAHCLAK